MPGVQAALAGWRQSSKDKRPLIPTDKKSESQSQSATGPFSDPSQNSFRFRTGDIDGGPSSFPFGFRLPSSFSHISASLSNVRYFDASDLRSLLRDNARVLVPAAIGACVFIALLGLLLGLSPAASGPGVPGAGIGIAAATPSPGLALSPSESEPASIHSEKVTETEADTYSEPESETESDSDSESNSNSGPSTAPSSGSDSETGTNAAPVSSTATSPGSDAGAEGPKSWAEGPKSGAEAEDLGSPPTSGTAPNAGPEAAKSSSAHSISPTLAPLAPRAWQTSETTETSSPGPAPLLELELSAPAPAPGPATATATAAATAPGAVLAHEKFTSARSPAPAPEPRKEVQMLHAGVGSIFHKIPLHLTTIEHTRKPETGTQQAHATDATAHGHQGSPGHYSAAPKKKNKGSPKSVFYPKKCVGAVAAAHQCNCPVDARCERKYYCNHMWVCRCLGEFKNETKDDKGNLTKCSKHR